MRMHVKLSHEDEILCTHEMTRMKQGTQSCYIRPMSINERLLYKTILHIPEE